MREVEGDLAAQLRRMAFVGTFALGISVTVALLTSAARLGLPMPLRSLFAGVALLAASAFAPFLLPDGWHSDRYRRATVPLVSLVVFLSPVLGLVVPSSLLLLIYMLIAAIGAKRALPWLRLVTRRQVALLVGGPFVMGLYFFGRINHPNNLHVYSPEYGVLGIAHQDTLFHAAVANMIQFQHVVSTGLDGKVTFHYHIGSHAWFAGFSIFSHQQMVVAQMVGLATVAVPGILLFLFLAAITVDSSFDGSAAFIVLGGAAGIVAIDSMASPPLYFSASHVFGVVVVLAAVPALVGLMGERDAAATRWAIGRDGILMPLVFLAAAVKISAGLLLAVAVGYAIVRTRRARAVGPLLFLSATVVVSTILFRDTSGAGKLVPGLLTFVRQNAVVTVAAMIVPACLLAVLAAEHRRSATLWTAFRSGQTVMSETILVVTVAAMIPVVFFTLPAESAYYFLDIPRWLALPILLAWLSTKDMRAFLRSVRGRAIGVAVSVVVVVVGAVLAIRVLPVLNAPGRIASLTTPMLSALARHSSAPPTPPRAPALFSQSLRLDHRLFSRAFVAAVDSSSGSRTVTVVDAARRQYGKGLAVFVPPSNIQFWSYASLCSAQPFFIPALAGVPMLAGLPPASPACRTDYYGYPQYGSSSRTTELSPGGICQRARRWGYRSVLVLLTVSPDTEEVLHC